mmetsp:Transcript_160019/g.282130  ORF Transcript_160019/g.282130 Transcript_160019/m.282130 type:complete len:226 (-) Transcript_160019:185-862(-)
MVCGTIVGVAPTMHAPGIWAVEKQTSIYTKERDWQTPVYTNVQCFGPWVDQSSNFVPTLVIPDAVSTPTEVDSAPKSPHSTSSGSVDSALTLPALSEPRQARQQTAGRAAKRQRGRERRKMYKALKRLESGFEERAAAVATELKLVVKSTFVDVLDDDAKIEVEVPLPAPLFETTKEIDQFRRDYRRFRMGHHQGARGEIESLTQMLDLRRVTECQPRPVAAVAA